MEEERLRVPERDGGWETEKRRKRKNEKSEGIFVDLILVIKSLFFFLN